MDNQVECYSGNEYADRPMAFHWDAMRLEIDNIEGQWRVPGEKCFRVRTRDGRRFMLKYVELSDEWQIVLL